jgi:FAD/FMN-containing dehydrogenase
VDRSGTPRTVVATREHDDPNRELWWAHTGGGGGNFGVVTKYWLRTPDATGTDPATVLPAPPRQARAIRDSIPWSALTRTTFTGLVRTYVTWLEHNSAPGSRFARLNSDLTCLHVHSSPTVGLTVTVDPSEPDSDALVADFRAAVLEPLGVPFTVADSTFPWLVSTAAFAPPDTGPSTGARSKTKGAYLRRSYTDAQLATIHHYLTATALSSPQAGLIMSAYGGAVNALASDATAVPQRDSILKVLTTVSWLAPSQDETHLSWVQTFYRDVYAATGGVPVIDSATDGTYINYPDVDLLDPQWNTSGQDWSTLYYKRGYERLQRVKARWDPRDVFNHALSVRLPD